MADFVEIWLFPNRVTSSIWSVGERSDTHSRLERGMKYARGAKNVEKRDLLGTIIWIYTSISPSTAKMSFNGLQPGQSQFDGQGVPTPPPSSSTNGVNGPSYRGQLDFSSESLPGTPTPHAFNQNGNTSMGSTQRNPQAFYPQSPFDTYQPG